MLDPTCCRHFCSCFLQNFLFHQELWELINIASGLVTDNKVTCDQAIEKSVNSLRATEEKDVSTFFIHRKDKVTPMAVIIFGLLINNDLLIVNTQLFYRIIVVINEKNRLKNASSMSWHQGLLLYRRCNTMCLKEVQKIQQWFKFVNMKDSTSLPGECFYVIDGGPLLHSVTWPRPGTYEDIFTSYE